MVEGSLRVCGWMGRDSKKRPSPGNRGAETTRTHSLVKCVVHAISNLFTNARSCIEGRARRCGVTYANEDGRREVLAREAAHLVAISENSDFCGNSAVGTFGTEGFAAFAGSDCLAFRVGRDW